MKSNQAEQKVPFSLNIKENHVLDLFVLFFKTKSFFLENNLCDINIDFLKPASELNIWAC